MVGKTWLPNRAFKGRPAQQELMANRGQLGQLDRKACQDLLDHKVQ
jgi:hypothetical protein